MTDDGLIPIRLVEAAAQFPAADALLLLVGAVPDRAKVAVGWAAMREVPPPSSHPLGCRCCGGRDGFVLALADLLRQRATGHLPPFRAIVLCVPGELRAPVRQSLETDRFLSARFRLDPHAREN